MSDDCGTIVLDLDGVLYLDAIGIPGVRETLESLVGAGWRLVYATNNSTKTRETVVRHIEERTGFRAEPDDAVTSAMAAAAHLAGRVRTAGVVGSTAIRSELKRVGIDVVDLRDDPEAVVVGLDRSLTYDTVDRAARAIRSGAHFVATNRDATYPTPTGLAPGAGMIVAAVEIASGVEPISCGKPERPFAELVRARVGPGPVVIVGDRAETDLALGKDHGWTTVLALTGVTPDPTVVPPELHPDHVISSIVELTDVLGIGGR